MSAAPTVDDAIARYLDHLVVERGSAANTITSYRRDLQRYRDFLAGRTIVTMPAITEADVRDFLVALRRGDPDNGVSGLADSSVARTLVAARGFHKFCAAEGLTVTDVAHSVSPPKPLYLREVDARPQTAFALPRKGEEP